MSHSHDTIRAVEWRDSALRLLDQRLLPQRQEFLKLETAEAVAAAIRDMVVRGAPAIGVAAAYGVVLAARSAWRRGPADWRQEMEQELGKLGAARPTAVNLRWALERMRKVAHRVEGDPGEVLLHEAKRIHAEDIDANRRMGELGAALIEEPCSVLTHCNTGSLATGGFGTALGVIRAAYAAGRIGRVYAGETRPWLQGARLTAWELVQDRIPVTLLADGAAAWLMGKGKIGWVIVGADRIAANGDVANKIGTYSTAVSARHHGVKFMVVAPTSTIDPSTPDGASIPIEHRPEREVLELGGEPVAARGAAAWNPSFDVTPAALIDAIVTEKGVVLNPAMRGVEELIAEG
ncbi:MAG TPA: S-methyl-5-thioribose-1-phosphate isomerase [Gammaproteobacteria bacterium]|nr:S-methyl-5-thioribose-1-phosphate isomerase [Gammaproteobacteria bacterium]